MKSSKLQSWSTENKIVYLAMQRRNEGGQGGRNSLGAEPLRRAPKSPNNVASTFFSSTFTSKRRQVRTWGRQTCFLSRVPSNLVTPL